MAAFSRLYEIASFRAAFGAFLIADEAEVVDAGRQGTDPETLASLEPSSADIVGVLQVLREIVQNEGIELLVADLEQQLNPPEVDKVRRVITRLGFAQVDPRDALITRAENSYLPVVTFLTATTDYRVVALEDAEGPELVPVTIVRMSFDEPIGGGSNAIVFQLRSDEFRLIQAELAKVEKQRSHFDDKVGALLREKLDPGDA